MAQGTITARALALALGTILASGVPDATAGKRANTLEVAFQRETDWHRRHPRT